jgi:hypothetical protein
MKLKDIAKVIRSKNAGPFWITLDIMFFDRSTYERVKSTGVLNAAYISGLYHTPERNLLFFTSDLTLSFKISLKRNTFSGDIGDSDIYGAQQHAPLLDIDLPIQV